MLPDNTDVQTTSPQARQSIEWSVRRRAWEEADILKHSIILEENRRNIDHAPVPVRHRRTGAVTHLSNSRLLLRHEDRTRGFHLDRPPEPA